MTEELNNVNEEAAKARAAAEAVLRMAEKRETPQSPLGASMQSVKKLNNRLSATSTKIRKDLQADMMDLSQDIQSTTGQIHDRFVATSEQIRKDFQAEMNDYSKGIKSTQERLRNSLDQARSSIMLKKNAPRESGEEELNEEANEEKKESSDEKILSDLGTVEVKITHCGLLLCRSEQKEEWDDYDSDTDAGDDATKEEMLLAAIGFLEACVDRMDELIEAGLDGFVLPETLEASLATRERLHLMLERCESPYAAAFSRGTEVP